MTDARRTAANALREATAALAAGVVANGSTDNIDQSEAPELAYYIAQTLDVLGALMHTVDLDPVPVNTAEQTLHTVARHIHDGAALAHRAAQVYVPPTRPVLTRDRARQPDC